MAIGGKVLIIDRYDYEQANTLQSEWHLVAEIWANPAKLCHQQGCQVSAVNACARCSDTNSKLSLSVEAVAHAIS